jgi:CheY-like chemotaxis protein
MDSFDVNPQPEAKQFNQSESGSEARMLEHLLCPQSTPENPIADGGSPASDRRRKRRVLISAPVRVRRVEPSDGAPDEISSTIDVSRNGLLLLTSSRSFHRGMEVAVTFPYTKAPGVVQAEQPGSVVRVSATSEGQIAVAIAFGIGFSSRPKVAAEKPVKKFSSAGDPRRPLVLVVESEDPARDATKVFLCAQGYEVIAVTTASDAREVLNMFTPALLIAEIEGEGLPGFDLCAHVKATPRLRHVPVMLTTRSAYPSDYSSAHSLGAVVCMAKPYRQERLGHVVSLLAPQPGAKDHVQPPRPADPTRRTRRPGAHRNHPRLRFT